MIFGSVTVSADNACSQKLYRFIRNEKIECRRIKEENGRLIFTIGVESWREVRSFLESLNCEYEIISKKGFVPLLQACFARKGLLLGVLVCFVLISLLSDVVLVIDISTDSPKTKQAILNVLLENDIKAGSSLKNVDLTVIERRIKSRVQNVGWVGISVDGNRLIIDTLQYTPKPEFTVHRLPSDIVSKENGVIDSVELLDGQLLKPVGSGVAKGDTIVSGKVVTDKISYKDGKEQHDISTRYSRAAGCIYGTFERKMTFEQPFIDQTKLYKPQKEKAVYSVSLFDFDLVLNGAEGNYDLIDRNEHRPEMFGLDLPVAFTENKVSEFTFAAHALNKAQATDAAKQKAEKYENNFLSAYEIRDKTEELKETDDGVLLEVTYTLYGQMGEERDFFIPK